MEKPKIVQAIRTHLQKYPDIPYNKYYVGVTNNPRKRIFEKHKVAREGQWYIYAKTRNTNIAREIEKYFLDQGMQGAIGGGNDNSIYVYVYKISKKTIQYETWR